MSKIINKARELGQLIANSKELENLRQKETDFLNDYEAQLLLKEINLIKSDKSIKTDNDNLTILYERLYNLTSYKNLLQAQRVFNKLIKDIQGVLNYYISGNTKINTNKYCSGCNKHCIL